MSELKDSDLVISVYSTKKGAFTTPDKLGVKVTHKPSGLSVSCANYKSQHANRAAALRGLKELFHQKAIVNCDQQEIEIDNVFWEQMREAAKNSKWMPEDYTTNDWVSDVCRFLINGWQTGVSDQQKAELKELVEDIDDQVCEMIYELDQSNTELTNKYLTAIRELKAKHSQLIDQM